MTMMFPRWTAEEDALAKAFVAAGIGPDALNGKIPGRTGKAVYTRVYYLKMTPDKRERANIRKRCARDGLPTISPQARKRAAGSAIFDPPPEVIHEAVLRALAPRSLTAIICGDPPLIASALGKRMAGVVA